MKRGEDGNSICYMSASENVSTNLPNISGRCMKVYSQKYVDGDYVLWVQGRFSSSDFGPLLPLKNC